MLASFAWRWLPTLWMASFALLALLVAGLGIYGAVSYAVSRRAREFGIRLALGAEQKDLIRLALAQGLFPVLIGRLVGIAVATNLKHGLTTLTYNPSSSDAVIYLVSAGTLGITALLASYPPARRVSNQDPTLALRTE